MTWKDEIKKVNLGGGEERFSDSDRDWMEDEAANAFNPERHINGVINDILGSAKLGGGLLEDIAERLGKEEEQAHISFPRYFDRAKVRRQLLPIIEEIVRSTIEVDMDKYTYSGP